MATASRCRGCSAGTSDGVRGPALVAALCAAVSTFFAVKFLLRYFDTNRLTPFAVYCVAIGLVLTVGFAIT